MLAIEKLISEDHKDNDHPCNAGECYQLLERQEVGAFGILMMLQYKGSEVVLHHLNVEVEGTNSDLEPNVYLRRFMSMNLSKRGIM